MSSLDDNGEYGNIGRIYAWDLSGLRQCLRLKFLQLFAALIAYGCATIIIQPMGYLHLFVTLGSFGGNLFLPDVSSIVATNVQFFQKFMWIGMGFQCNVTLFIRKRFQFGDDLLPFVCLISDDFWQDADSIGGLLKPIACIILT